MQTGVYDPLLIGDKPKWYCQVLRQIKFPVYDDDASSLGAAVSAALDQRNSGEYSTGASYTVMCCQMSLSNAEYIMYSTLYSDMYNYGQFKMYVDVHAHAHDVVSHVLVCVCRRVW